MEELKRRFLNLDPAQRGKLLLALVALVAVGFWLINQDESDPVESAASDPVSYSGVVQVHVVGEVEAPGLYELGLGSRVENAIEIAGGFTDQAIQHSVNLARVLSDGEQLVVLGPSDVDGAQETGLISINRASIEQLDKLPGVGPALAQRILDHRATLGSFSDIRQLREVTGIGEKLFARIKDLVTL